MVDRTLAEHRTFSRAGGRQNPAGNTWPLFFNFRSNSSWPGTFFFFLIWSSVNLLRFKSSLQSTAGLVSSPILDSCTWDFLAFFSSLFKVKYYRFYSRIYSLECGDIFYYSLNFKIFTFRKHYRIFTSK